MSRQVLTQQANALSVWVRLLRAHASLKRTFNAQLQADHGLTVNDYEALLLLSHEPETHLKRVELAERLQLTPSGVTRLLDGLQDAGYVEKAACDADARVTYAVLTAAGRSALEAASCSHVAAVTALFTERFEPAELETLASLLGRLPGAAGADSAACSPS